MMGMMSKCRFYVIHLIVIHSLRFFFIKFIAGTQDSQ